MKVQDVVRDHQVRFGSQPAVFRAPGRVNLIGEHTDYSDGFVLPAAIDYDTTVAASLRHDGLVEIRSLNLNESTVASLNDLLKSRRGHWSDYPAGVLWALQEKGCDFSDGVSLTLYGNVPMGAGLSSSASLEVATAFALLNVSELTLSRYDIARLCQYAENKYVGANCGIMDQFIAATGTHDHALLIDCRTLESEPVPIPPDVSLVITNSMIKHSIADGEYNIRRREIEEGVAILQEHGHQIKNLRDIDEHGLSDLRDAMPDNVFRRCRHVVTDSWRAQLAAESLRHGDLAHVGKLMNESFISYRDDFEASCPEIDVLVPLAQEIAGCFGSRLTGGGFGGCTISLVESARAADFAQVLAGAYSKATGITPEIYLCRASQGASRIQLSEDKE